MNEEPEWPDLDPIRFDLACGTMVGVRIGWFWTKVSPEDWQRGVRPARFHALRIYCDDGDPMLRRLRRVDEWREGKEYEGRFSESLWLWLLHHAHSRERMEHEDLDDFCHVLADAADRIQAEDEDMVEHLRNLASLTQPEVFDQYDDSIFNDQED
jgi:hypothetical protein